jgi:hypothetical protein
MRVSAEAEHLGHFGADAEDAVIVIARPQLFRDITRSVGATRVLTFTSLEELDLWRAAAKGPHGSIAIDVAGSLVEIGCQIEALPRKLRDVIDALSDEPRVPAMTMLEQHWPSRRSFYRFWNERIAEPPSAFLRRVRARHARRLISLGLSRKEAAHLAGYSSVDQLRRYVGR